MGGVQAWDLRQPQDPARVMKQKGGVVSEIAVDYEGIFAASIFGGDPINAAGADGSATREGGRTAATFHPPDTRTKPPLPTVLGRAPRQTPASSSTIQPVCSWIEARRMLGTTLNCLTIS